MADPADEDSRSNTDFDAKAASTEHETVTAVKSEGADSNAYILLADSTQLSTKRLTKQKTSPPLPTAMPSSGPVNRREQEDTADLHVNRELCPSTTHEAQRKINKVKREGNVPVGPSTGQEDKDAVYLRKTANWYITTFMAMHYGRGRFEDLHNSETTWNTLNDRSEELDKLGHMIKSLWFDLRRILAVFGFPYPTYPEPEDLIGEPEPEEMWEVIWDLLAEISCELTKDIRIGLSRKERVGEYVSSILILLDLLKEEIVVLRRELQAESKSLSFGFASQNHSEGVHE